MLAKLSVACNVGRFCDQKVDFTCVLEASGLFFWRRVRAKILNLSFDSLSALAFAEEVESSEKWREMSVALRLHEVTG